MATTDIGRAVPLMRGEYSPFATYELNDIVTLNGSMYWHYSHTVTTNVAPQATDTWMLVLDLTAAEEYISRAETAAGTAEQAKDDAVTAKTAAETASTSASGSSTAASEAQTAAEAAKDAAIAAKTDAVSAKTDAESAKTAAQTAATAASGSATAANSSAGNAEYYAGEASTAATTATGKADEASASAATASSAATTATGAKDTAVSSAAIATTKAGEASTSATSAASSAAAAQAVKDSIPPDYTSLSNDVADVKTQLNEYAKETVYDEVSLGTLALGSYQSGSINPLAKTSACTQTLIPLSEDIYINIESGFACSVLKYTTAGAYTGIATTYTESTKIDKTNGISVQLEFKYSDARLLTAEEQADLEGFVKAHFLVYTSSKSVVYSDDLENELVNYATKTDLDSYAEKTDLNEYAKTTKENKLDLGTLAVGQYQNGSINPLAKTGACTQTLIPRSNDIYINIENGYKCVVQNFTNAGAYSGANTYTENTTISKNTSLSIQLEFRHSDNRLLTAEEQADLDGFVDAHFLVYDGTENVVYTNDMNEAIEEALADYSKNDFTVPDYWKTELASKEAVIMGLQDTGSNSFSFAFITDTHWAANAKKSPALLNDIIKKCYVPIIVIGGDIVAGPSGATKTAIKTEAQEFTTLFDELPAKRLTCIGNHDDNSISNLFAQTLNENEQYNYYERYTEDFENEIVYGDTGNYYYFDDKKNKVRYIITDTNDVPYIDDGQGGVVYSPMTKGYYRQAQLTWFASKALIVPDDTWSVIVFSHYPVNQGIIVNDDLFMNVLKAFALKTSYTGTSSSQDPTFSASVSVNYESAGGIVIGWFAGHQHVDKDVDMGSYPFHCIVTINDGAGPGKTAGTTTEQGFDIVTVNQSTKNVNMTRIGLGSNRSFNYSLS